WPAARREFELGIRLNANYANAHFYYANYLLIMRRFDEALVESRLAEALDPVSLRATTNTAAVLFFAGRYDESIEESQHVLEIEPDHPQGWLDLGTACQEKALTAQALRALTRAVKLSGRNPIYLACLAHAHAVAGQRGKANGLLKELHAAR